VPGDASTLPRPSDEDLNRLFLDERQQTMNLSGLGTWQVPALTILERDFSGFAGPGETDAITVNEESWIPALRKEKWWDMQFPTSSLVQHPFDGIGRDEVWSVGIDPVWQQLRNFIEVANRLVLESARGDL
jgi:hypothetical protein